jgi:hypothetical protein
VLSRKEVADIFDHSAAWIADEYKLNGPKADAKQRSASSIDDTAIGRATNNPAYDRYGNAAPTRREPEDTAQEQPAKQMPSGTYNRSKMDNTLAKYRVSERDVADLEDRMSRVNSINDLNDKDRKTLTALGYALLKARR